MPRDGSGNYTLPGGINPVISGTTIDVAWANPTLADVATALTDSLSRTGSGGMLVPFLNADGAVGSPGISWVNETTSGLYRFGAGDQRFSTLGTDVMQITGDANNPLKVFSNAMFSDVVNADLDRTIGAAWTFTALQSMAASAAPGAGLNLGVGVAPSAPVNGDIWVDGTAIFARVAGITQNLTGSNAVGASVDNTRMLVGDGSGGWVDAGAFTVSIQSNNFVIENSLIIEGSTTESLNINVSSGLANFNAGGTVFYMRTGMAWRFDQPIMIRESSALSSVGTLGQIWCNDHITGANPLTLEFTNDSSDNYRLDGLQRRALLLDTQISNDDVLSNIANWSNFFINPARRYKISLTLFWSSGTVPDIKVFLDYDQTPEDQGFAYWVCTSAVSTVETDVELDAFNVIAPTTMETGTNCLKVEYVFESHATLQGVLNVQFAQNVSNAVFTTILQPSFIEVQENDNIS